jgi:hypothetical protein
VAKPITRDCAATPKLATVQAAKDSDLDLAGPEFQTQFQVVVSARWKAPQPVAKEMPMKINHQSMESI